MMKAINQQQEHAQSYYAATANERTTYPMLEGGKIGIVLNRIPAVGRINKNIYYCQGYSGHGVSATHVMSEIVSDGVAGTMEKFDLFADMGHFRIPGSQWFGNQIIALGMLYYKMKDKL